MHSAPSGSSDDLQLLCDPAEKKTLELRNQASVFRYVADFFEHAPERNPYTRGTILELHHMTIANIYPCAGSFRVAGSRVTISGASFSPSPPYRIGAMLTEILGDAMAKCRPLRDSRDTWDQLEQIASVFHRFEQLHPFMGGNGRVGRALLLLALYDHHLLIPPDDIWGYMARRRSNCLLGLKAADAGDLDPLIYFLWRGVLDANVQRLIRTLDGAIQRLGLLWESPPAIATFRQPSSRARLSDATYLKRADAFFDAFNAEQSKLIAQLSAQLEEGKAPVSPASPSPMFG